MRFVIRDLNDKPAILKACKTLDKLDKIVLGAGNESIRTEFYQDPYQDSEDRRQMRVRDKLNDYYLHKCAYCERHCKAEIEHYRPKAKVTEDENHPGYYWLCYEWSNLLPSCHECNGSGGKMNQFPVKGTRVTAPPLQVGGLLDTSQTLVHSSPLIDEQPYLLHPEIDNPSDFLCVEIDPKREGIKLYGTDGQNDRGEQTIKICNLNRVDLKINRLSKLNDFIKEINFVFKSLADDSIKPENLKKSLMSSFHLMDMSAKDDHTEHTILLRFAMATDAGFAYLVLPRLEASQRAVVLAAFTKYRELNPF